MRAGQSAHAIGSETRKAFRLASAIMVNRSFGKVKLSRTPERQRPLRWVAQATGLYRAATRRSERSVRSNCFGRLSSWPTPVPFRPAGRRTVQAGRPCHPTLLRSSGLLKAGTLVLRRLRIHHGFTCSGFFTAELPHPGTKVRCRAVIRNAATGEGWCQRVESNHQKGCSLACRSGVFRCFSLPAD